MTPQEKRVLNYLKEHGKITQRDAAVELGIWRLSARIANMRAEGYRIHTEYREVDTRDGSKARIGVYHLIGEPV